MSHTPGTPTAAIPYESPFDPSHTSPAAVRPEYGRNGINVIADDARLAKLGYFARADGHVRVVLAWDDGRGLRDADGYMCHATYAAALKQAKAVR